MADPGTIIGGVASVAQIAVYCLKTIQTLEHLRAKYRDSSVLLESLYTESHLIHSSLLELDDLFHNEKNQLSAALRATPKLFANLERTLLACYNVYTCLDKELNKLADSWDATRSTKLIFKEKILQEYLVQINSHKSTLTLLLQGVQMHSLSLILEILTFQNPMIKRVESFDSYAGSTQVPQEWKPGLFSCEPPDKQIEPSRTPLLGSPISHPDARSPNSLQRPRASSSTSPRTRPLRGSPRLGNIDEDSIALPSPADTSVPVPGPSRIAASPRNYTGVVFDDAFGLAINPDGQYGLEPVSSPLTPTSEDTDKIVVGDSSPSSNTRALNGRAGSKWTSVSTITSLASLQEYTDRATSQFPEVKDRPRNFPLPLDEVFGILEASRQTMTRSTIPSQRLQWAEEVMYYIAFVSPKPKTSIRTGRSFLSSKTISDAQQVLLEDAKSVIEESAQAGDGKALHLKAQWFATDDADQLRTYIQAYGKGCTRAAARIGEIMKEGSKNDQKTALGYLLEGQKAHDAACTLQMAEAMFKGELDIKKNHREASQLLRYAATKADLDCPDAAYRLAELQTASFRKANKDASKISKSDLPVDENQARENYILAAYHRHPKALLKLGLAYQDGSMGCRINAPLSLHFLRLASQAGEIEADSAMSNWFWFGEGDTLEANPELAFKFSRKAAEEGFIPAFCQIGFFYEKGIGTKQDPRKAKDWYLRGAGAKDPSASKRLESLRSSFGSVI